jgi:hypothetical protein
MQCDRHRCRVRYLTHLFVFNYDEFIIIYVLRYGNTAQDYCGLNLFVFSFDSDHFGTSTKIFSRFGGIGIERP